MIPRREESRSRIFLAFVCLYLIWGSTYLAIRFAIETLPPLLMAGLRFFVAGLILYLIARFRGAVKPTPNHWRAVFLIGGLLLLGGNGGVVYAEQYVPSAIASLFIATVPVWMVFLEWMTRKVAPTRREFVGIFLGILGIWFLLSPGVAGQSINIKGALILLMSALSWSIGSLIARRAKLPDSQLLAIGMEMLAGGILLCLAGVLRGELSHINFAHFSLRSILSFGYLIIFGSLIGFTAYLYLLKVVSVAQATTYAYVNPIVACFLGWSLGGESMTTQTIFAAVIIIVGVIVIHSHQNNRHLPEIKSV